MLFPSIHDKWVVNRNNKDIVESFILDLRQAFYEPWKMFLGTGTRERCRDTTNGQLTRKPYMENT